MLFTGKVRHIDDLGRIVIPKNIRKIMEIEDGMPMEIWINKKTNEIILKSIDK